MIEPEAKPRARTTRVGRHLPTSGGLKKTLQLAREQGLEAVQIFVSNPQGWAAPTPRPDAEAFVRGIREINLDPVVAHAKYLINLASPDPEHRERSVRALAEVAEKARVRVCVDTAHAHVAGYDLSTPEGAREVARKIGATLGDRLALFHLNDARNGPRSHRDGHERIGEGHISEGAWQEIFEANPEVPAVMETPYLTPEVDAEQVRLVKELAGGLLLSPSGV